MSIRILLVAFLFISDFSYGADLKMNEEIDAGLTNIVRKEKVFLSSLRSTTIADPRLIDKDRITPFPIEYKLKMPAYSFAKMKAIAGMLGPLDNTSTIRRNASIIMDLEKGRTVVGFDTIQSTYYFFKKNNALVRIGQNDDDVLQTKATEFAYKVLGADSARFMLANVKTRKMMNPQDPSNGDDPVAVGKSYFFTRKINGRAIYGRIAYIKLQVNGDGSIIAGDICLPEIEPVEITDPEDVSNTQSRLLESANKLSTLEGAHSQFVAIN